MQNKSILVVDDQMDVLDSIGEYLGKDYDVTLATSGEEAISLLKGSQFDVVVTDLKMEILDGVQVLIETKKINSLTCVIILTGYGDMTSAIDALRHRADDYLLKPCNLNELSLRIEKCLEKREAFQKVKFYENILPVCIYCKSIRDDAGSEHGSGKWLQMEEYIHGKSGTKISHTFCPKCQDRAEREAYRD